VLRLYPEKGTPTRTSSKKGQGTTPSTSALGGIADENHETKKGKKGQDKSAFWPKMLRKIEKARLVRKRATSVREKRKRFH